MVEGQIWIRTVQVPGKGQPAVRIIVADTGIGMTEAVLERALEPFFTTKEPQQGMGLGLTVTKAIIEQLGGMLTIESQRGLGTTVTMIMPTPPPEQDDEDKDREEQRGLAEGLFEKG
jgi:signal transduction histidine kinase